VAIILNGLDYASGRSVALILLVCQVKVVEIIKTVTKVCIVEILINVLQAVAMKFWHLDCDLYHLNSERTFSFRKANPTKKGVVGLESVDMNRKTAKKDALRAII